MSLSLSLSVSQVALVFVVGAAFCCLCCVAGFAAAAPPRPLCFENVSVFVRVFCKTLLFFYCVENFPHKSSIVSLLSVNPFSFAFSNLFSIPLVLLLVFLLVLLLVAFYTALLLLLRGRCVGKM